VEVTKKYYAPEISDPRPATSFVPPEILGRDLYGEVGFTYDLELAQDLFEQAGYSDPSDFPTITLLVNVGSSAASGIHLLIAEKLADMWLEHLGVEVLVEITTFGKFIEQLNTNPPEMYRFGWAADHNDPENFYSNMFETGSRFNLSGYSNSDFDEIVRRAAEMTDPAERQLLYIQAEQILCELDPAVIPIYHGFSDLR
jgi:ABC-type oligopeptide transport system substrate-binding subunit